MVSAAAGGTTIHRQLFVAGRFLDRDLSPDPSQATVGEAAQVGFAPSEGGRVAPRVDALPDPVFSDVSPSKRNLFLADPALPELRILRAWAMLSRKLSHLNHNGKWCAPP